MDVCGTGGDRMNTFNISTTVAFVLASAGVNVAKHGNRAVTSQAGSADVLEALGIKIHLTPDQAAASLRDHRFTFFFAPDYQSAIGGSAAPGTLPSHGGGFAKFGRAARDGGLRLCWRRGAQAPFG